MRIICEKDPQHQKFKSVLLVKEIWIVDASGAKIEEHETRESFPAEGNHVTCAVCGGHAHEEPE